MKRSTYAIIGLVVALIGSNLWWVYRAIDAGVTAAYQDDSFRAASTALKQHEAILPLVLEGKRNKAEIVAAAKAAADDSEPFEKDGVTHVGWVGLKFDAKNQLVGVANE
ncbi:MAG: hypothetical protein KJ795_12515 [Gammaproteobacteria bacterium]|nr:hypothetical protein [Gammaproteobacteria bacterium]MBU1776349.1 hypothetical protein [Gammaproteobacteria bacterium]MBU1968201.1 hypothetical protein [Gammaproteobacteria bacterium]